MSNLRSALSLLLRTSEARAQAYIAKRQPIITRDAQTGRLSNSHVDMTAPMVWDDVYVGGNHRGARS